MTKSVYNIVQIANGNPEKPWAIMVTELDPNGNPYSTTVLSERWAARSDVKLRYLMMKRDEERRATAQAISQVMRDVVDNGADYDSAVQQVVSWLEVQQENEK